MAGIEFGAVLRSRDSGSNWTGHCRGALRDPHSLAFHPADGAWVYEGGDGGGALSRDAGQTWTRVRAGLDRRYGWAVAADPARPEIWYLSAAPGPVHAHRGHDAGAGIYRSRDGGAWERLGGGLPQPLDTLPYALVTPPAAPGHLYAGLGGGEIWHSPDHGDTWTWLPLTLPGIHHGFVVAG